MTGVRNILDANIVDTPFGSGIYVTVVDGNVSLSGLVAGFREINATLDKIRKIEAVNEVTNDVQFVPAQSGV